MPNQYILEFTALPEHIDELGHVNNSVWVQWVQEIATAHWSAVAPPEIQEQFFWVVVRHEIDYRGNIVEGETATGVTWIDGAPKGAKSDRVVEFSDATGKRLVSARTTWAMLERSSGRLARVRPDILEGF